MSLSSSAKIINNLFMSSHSVNSIHGAINREYYPIKTMTRLQYKRMKNINLIYMTYNLK